jgi:membrane-bound inhibitor of C-type lysozyme
MVAAAQSVGRPNLAYYPEHHCGFQSGDLMDRRLLFAALFLGATSAGCDHPDDPTLEYFCSDSRNLTVTYFSAPAPGHARLVADDETYELPHVTSASGARFSDGKVDWWEHGGKAELSRDGASAECVELP